VKGGHHTDKIERRAARRRQTPSALTGPSESSNIDDRATRLPSRRMEQVAAMTFALRSDNECVNTSCPARIPHDCYALSGNETMTLLILCCCPLNLGIAYARVGASKI
jgi:hypothetical protein